MEKRGLANSKEAAVLDSSSKHAHHSAMRAVGGGNGETRKDMWYSFVTHTLIEATSRSSISDFSVTMASAAFAGLTPIKRHRLVNGLLKEEFEQMGLHALSLRLKNVEEAEKEGLVQDKSARADVPSCKGSVI